MTLKEGHFAGEWGLLRSDWPRRCQWFGLDGERELWLWMEPFRGGGDLVIRAEAGVGPEVEVARS
jgi:hypothetical protein